MLDNFREIYERELENYENPLEKLILSSRDVRMFVYEICKACIVSQQAVNDKIDNDNAPDGFPSWDVMRPKIY